MSRNIAFTFFNYFKKKRTVEENSAADTVFSSREEASVSQTQAEKMNSPSESDLLTKIETQMSKGNSSVSLEKAYEALAGIVEKHPEYGQKALQILDSALNMGTNNYLSLAKAADVFRTVLKKQPNLGQYVLSTVRHNLKSQDTTEYSLLRSSMTLAEVVQAQPSLGERILPIVKKNLQSPRNTDASLAEAYSTLYHVAKQCPKLQNDVLAMVKVSLNTKKHDDYSFSLAHKVMESVAENKPQLSEDIIKFVLKENKQNQETFPLLALCMQNTHPNRFLNVSEEQKEALDAAYNLRFLPSKEINFICQNFSVNQLAKLDIDSDTKILYNGNKVAMVTDWRNPNDKKTAFFENGELSHTTSLFPERQETQTVLYLKAGAIEIVGSNNNGVTVFKYDRNGKLTEAYTDDVGTQMDPHDPRVLRKRLSVGPTKSGAEKTFSEIIAQQAPQQGRVAPSRGSLSF